MATRQGVIVLNDPLSLSNAINKMYFQHFPEKVRPKTVISRNVEDIQAFFEETHHKRVLKHFKGPGGRKLFLVTQTEARTINQSIEVTNRVGHAVVKE